MEGTSILDTKKNTLPYWNRGSITIEAMIVFPAVLFVLFTLMFFIVEGRMEMVAFNSVSAGADKVAQNYYTTYLLGNGLSGMSQMVVDGTIDNEKLKGTVNDFLAGDKIKQLPQHICEKFLTDSAKKQVTDDLGLSINASRFTVNVIMPKQGVSARNDTPGDVEVELHQNSGSTFGPMVNLPPLRMTVYEKCWDGGSSDLQNWLARAFPKMFKAEVYTTRTGDCYHTSSCRHVEESKIPTTKEAATLSGYRPCKTCGP